jgi:putative ABC transport system permease protein
LSPGDTITLPSATGIAAFEVAGTFRDYTSDRGVVAVHMDEFRRDWRTRRVDGLGLTATPGVEARELRRVVDRTLGNARGIQVRTNSEIRSASLAIFDRTFTITRVLQVLVGIVAFLGILSALQSLQMERVREMAILRALGWVPGQVRRLVIGQTALLGVMAGALAIPLGVILAAILIRVINVRAFAWTMDFDLAPAVLAQGLFLAATAAIIGGIYPAWRSAQRRPATDLRDE